MTAEQGSATVFALLDDSDSSATRRSSRLYSGFVREVVCRDAAQLEASCKLAQDAQYDAPLHAVLLADYEFGYGLLGVPSATPFNQSDDSAQSGTGAALRFLLFSRCEMLSRDEVDAWLAQQDNHHVEPSVAGIATLEESVDEAAFSRAIDAVHAALRDGDSYQVNYTYRLFFETFGTPVALYRRLRARQPVRFGALIALPDARWVLSCSPELFVEKTGDIVRARPMKGTASRIPDHSQADAQAARDLAGDPKNRAENLMIVDLLRNDVSRVAQTGSVTVPALFSVEPYASVWQMTSTIEARLKPQTTFADVFRALFPCGSITGAPKHRTMQLIREIEDTPRGLYTGAIGWIDAPSHDQACGDFCFSVAIRTVTLDVPQTSSATASRRGTMGVGAGIVLDSEATAEHAECRLKARFLTACDPGFQLFETMYATREAGVRYVEHHLARLQASAGELGFLFDAATIHRRLATQCAALSSDQPHRMRLALSMSGAIELSAAPLAPLATFPDGAIGVLLADPANGTIATHADDLLLRHKTTRRADYDRGWREAEAHGAFDMLFFNAHGELTEGGRSNVFVQLDGKWWTPPLECGVLPGVMRARVLSSGPSEWDAKERVITRADLRRAEGLMLCNALRGTLVARIVSVGA